MPRSKRSKAKRSRDEARTLVPTRVHDRRRQGQDEVRTLMPTRVDDRGRNEQRSMRLNDVFDNFRREIEGATNPWSSILDRRFPREIGMLRPYAMEEGTLSRTPLVDMVDRGDRYNLRLEVPGIDKDNIQLNATEDAIEISGEQSEEESSEDKGYNYIYNERSYKSFYRSIPIPEEILPSKVTARMNNGILQIEIPKKDPSRPSGGSTRIEIG
jgi:HSP20 family protein